MGEINSTSTRAIRIDLTPMVDLGFLLITFFVFTTSMSQPKSMKLFLPKSTPDSTKISEDKTLSFLLGESGKIYFYPGNSINEVKQTDYADGIRRVIADKRSVLKQDANKLIVLIKPMATCKYQNVVNILDEMTINQVKTYYLIEPRVDEIIKLN